jgi:hypothetical protein
MLSFNRTAHRGPHTTVVDGTVTAVHIAEGQVSVDAGTVAVEIG